MNQDQQKVKKSFFNQISTRDVLIVLSLPLLLIIGVLITVTTCQFIPNYAGIIITVYFSLLVIIFLLSACRLYRVKHNFNKIEPEMQYKIHYSNTEPKGKVDSYFYRIFEMLNDGSSTKGEVNVSIYHTGKMGVFMVMNFLVRVVIFVLFAVIYFVNMKDIQSNNQFFVLLITVLFISLLELIANTVNTFLYWRTVYANGKDTLIAREDLENRLKSLEETIEEIKGSTSA